jgi:hypothetical protein
MPWWYWPARKKAVFIGRVNTHPIRRELFKKFKGQKDILVSDSLTGSKRYAKQISRADLSICPRGFGGSSFRFYESIELGTVPVLIGDMDTRPFQDDIPWNDYSFYFSSVERFDQFIKSGFDKIQIRQMTKRLPEIQQAISYQNWCKYVVRKLKRLSQ